MGLYEKIIQYPPQKTTFENFKWILTPFMSLPKNSNIPKNSTSPWHISEFPPRIAFPLSIGRRGMDRITWNKRRRRVWRRRAKKERTGFSGNEKSGEIYIITYRECFSTKIYLLFEFFLFGIAMFQHHKKDWGSFVGDLPSSSFLYRTTNNYWQFKKAFLQLIISIYTHWTFYICFLKSRYCKCYWTFYICFLNSRYCKCYSDTLQGGLGQSGYPWKSMQWMLDIVLKKA